MHIGSPEVDRDTYVDCRRPGLGTPVLHQKIPNALMSKAHVNRPESFYGVLVESVSLPCIRPVTLMLSSGVCFVRSFRLGLILVRQKVDIEAFILFSVIFIGLSVSLVVFIFVDTSELKKRGKISSESPFQSIVCLASAGLRDCIQLSDG